MKPRAKNAAQAEFAEALAAELGLDTETVTAALETVNTELAEQRAATRREAFQERLDEAVADGELTQEQADALLEAKESGVLGNGRGGGRGHRGFGGFGASDEVAPSAATEAASA